MRTKLLRSEIGLTLVEMMVSLLIFSVVTIGVVPLLASSIRGAALSRNLTLGKAMAQEAMERARGLPYYKAIDDQRTITAAPGKAREDLLDMVYPCASTDAVACPGYSATARTIAPLGTLAPHTYLTTCTSTSTNPACATQIDDDYTIYYVAEFKAAAGTTTQTVIPTNTPGSNYAWNASGRDSPPSQLLNLSITAASDVGGRVRTYKLESILGDRKFGDILISASATLDYGIQVETSFVETLTGATSTLTAIGGTARSTVEQRLVSSASQDVTSGELRLVSQPTASEPFSQPLDGTPKRGASIVGLTAPPASAPAAITVGTVTATHPTALLGGPLQVAGFLDTQAGNNVTTHINALSVNVADELPRANGGFDFTAQGDNANGFFWVQNQADFSNDAKLKLDQTRKLLALRRDTGTNRTLYGRTNATTGALGTAQRRVQTSGEVTIEEFRVFPVTFIPGANPRRSVLFIEDFTASVNCNSVPGAEVASGSWSASLLIWRDPINDGSTFLSNPLTGESPGHLTIPIGTLATGTFESRDLRTILAAAPYNVPGGNPLVYDDILDFNDVYLFKEPAKNGYLDTDGFTMQAPTTSVGAGGTSTSVDVDQAIGITTVPTSASLPQSGLRVSIGKLRCDALDAR